MMRQISQLSTSADTTSFVVGKMCLYSAPPTLVTLLISPIAYGHPAKLSGEPGVWSAKDAWSANEGNKSNSLGRKL